MAKDAEIAHFPTMDKIVNALTRDINLEFRRMYNEKMDEREKRGDVSEIYEILLQEMDK